MAPSGGLAPWLSLALTGAALTGFGYSLVYPGLGVEAVRLVPAQNRGLAMGAYTVFLDVALGFGTPALGSGPCGGSRVAAPLGGPISLGQTLIVTSGCGWVQCDA